MNKKLNTTGEEDRCSILLRNMEKYIVIHRIMFFTMAMRISKEETSGA